MLFPMSTRAKLKFSPPDLSTPLFSEHVIIICCGLSRQGKKKKSHLEKILQALLCAITWPWTSSKWLSKRHVKSTRTDQTLDWFPHPPPKPAPPPVFPISENSDFIFLVVQAQNSADSLHSILYHTPSIYFESKLSVLPSTYVPNLTISYHPYF